jgi:hypothetical protein
MKPDTGDLELRKSDIKTQTLQVEFDVNLKNTDKIDSDDLNSEDEQVVNMIEYDSDTCFIISRAINEYIESQCLNMFEKAKTDDVIKLLIKLDI